MTNSSLLALLVGIIGCGGAREQVRVETRAEESSSRETPPSVDGVSPEKLDEIASAFRMKQAVIGRCYTEAVQARALPKSAKGRITVAMVLSTDGRPSEVRITESTLTAAGASEKTVESCVVKTISTWRLPAPEVAMPFSFSYDFEPE